jgi:hypothetical protein
VKEAQQLELKIHAGSQTLVVPASPSKSLNHQWAVSLQLYVPVSKFLPRWNFPMKRTSHRKEKKKSDRRFSDSRKKLGLFYRPNDFHIFSLLLSWNVRKNLADPKDPKIKIEVIAKKATLLGQDLDYGEADVVSLKPYADSFPVPVCLCIPKFSSEFSRNRRDLCFFDRFLWNFVRNSSALPAQTVNAMKKGSARVEVRWLLFDDYSWLFLTRVCNSFPCGLLDLLMQLLRAFENRKTFHRISLP